MLDRPELPELTKRQEEILSLVVQTYINHPEPVSSKFLKETYDLSYSPATIRNELMVLDEKNYLYAPHTSSGRIPTDQGFRYYVKYRMAFDSLSQSEKRYISTQLQALPLAIEKWMRTATQQLTRTLRTASIITYPIAETNRFKHVELISIQGRLCLMVLVLQAGSVHQQMLTLADPLSQDSLSIAANRINSICANLNANDTRRKGFQLSLFEQEICSLVADLMEGASDLAHTLFRDGLSEMLPTFHEAQGAQQAIRLFEETKILSIIINEVSNATINTVEVVIGGEGKWEEMSHLSMVLSRYGIPNKASGALGVLGPVHLDYERAVSAVRYVGELVTQMLHELYQTNSETDDDAEPTDS